MISIFSGFYCKFNGIDNNINMGGFNIFLITPHFFTININFYLERIAINAR